MCSIDLEPCDVWCESLVTARKQHVCDCCGGLIRIGAQYTRHFSVYDKAPTSEKMCATCAKVCERFVASHGQRSSPSTMRELLEECIGERDDDSWRWRLDVLNMDRRAATAKRRAA